MKFKLLLTILTFAMIMGCAGIQKADLNSNNPQQAINEVEQIKSQAIMQQADLLAQESFEDGVDELSEAKEELNDEDDEEVLEHLAEAKAYFQKAMSEAKTRKKVPQRILESRDNVISANIYQSDELSEELAELDEDLIDETDNFEESLSVKDFSKYQKDYQKLEVKAVQHNELASVRKKVKNAKKRDAKDIASKTYSRAMSDLIAAENSIQQNPRNPNEYKDDVNKAEFSATLLSDVMAKLRGEAKGAEEDVALALVKQDRKLSELNSEVTGLNTKLSSASETINQNKQKLSEKEKSLAFQRELDKITEEFSEEEAEVYQQGNKVILRLKDIGFATGSAKVPGESMKLLSRVDQVVDQLNAGQIVIQGHTDSTGSQKINQKLSKQRAEAIKSYFNTSGNKELNIETAGLGDSRPLASNSTKEGRAINRRVDIIIDAEQETKTELSE